MRQKRECRNVNFKIPAFFFKLEFSLAHHFYDMMSYGYLSVGKDIHMNKNHPNQKHLTLSDRVYIEQELLQGSTFRSIAHVLHKDSSTISKEIRLHAMMPKSTSFKVPRCKQCRHYDSCKTSSICKMSGCRQLCWSCDYNRYDIA